MARQVRPLEAAAAALARRDRSAADLRAQLERRGVPADDAARTVERLEAAGYVDDARFAAARAETLATRGYGNAVIARELERQGIGRDEIGSALAQLEPETARAAALLERFGRAPKAARRLVAKGFDREAVAAALGDPPDA